MRMEAESYNINEEDYCIEDRKLSAIFHLLRLFHAFLGGSEYQSGYR